MKAPDDEQHLSHHLVDDVTADLFASAMLDRSRKTPPGEPTGSHHQETFEPEDEAGPTMSFLDRADRGGHGR